MFFLQNVKFLRYDTLRYVTLSKGGKPALDCIIILRSKVESKAPVTTKTKLK